MAFPTACYPHGGKQTAAPFVGPLDAYEGISTGAWSLVRRLLTSYTGNLIRIRRTSDSVEQDFGPLANGRLDVAGVLTFLGGGSGVVTTVYDQLTLNNWVQASGAMQPAWVEGLSEFNNAPAMYLGSAVGMECALNLTVPYSVLLTECNPLPLVNAGARTFTTLAQNAYINSSRPGGAGQAYYNGTIAPGFVTDAAVCEVLTAPNGGNFSLYTDGVDVTSGAVATGDWGLCKLGVSGWNGESALSNVAEIVTFNTDLSGAQVTAMQAIFNPATL